MNALFNAVTNEEFKKISFIETAQEVWTILQTTYEGTKAVKDSKLQRLTISFEEIKMEEDESFDEFYVKLKDILNLAFNLGETIPEPKIIRKVLRSLPERFHAKITVIEESKDIDKIPLIELVGNLQTYELGLSRIGNSGMGKSMTLKAKSSDIDESFNDEDFKTKSYITRQFKKFMKNANGRNFNKDRRQSNSSQFKGQDKGKKDAKEGGQYTVPEGPKCFGCQGFGHMKHGCPMYLDIAYEKLYKISEKHEKLYRLATKKLSDVELDREELSTKFDEAN